METNQTFEDAGPWAMCPNTIALKEAQSLRGPTKQPGIILSLGTGMPHPTTEDIQPSWLRQWFARTLVGRLLDSIDNGCRGDRQADAFIAEQPQLRDVFFRADTGFSGRVPNFDQVDGMLDWQQAASDAFRRSPDLERLVDCLRANMFYLELVSFPGSSTSSRARCRIQCVLKSNQPLWCQWQTWLQKHQAQVFVQNKPVSALKVQKGHQNICCDVDIAVPDERSLFSVEIAFGNHHKAHINGSPFSLAGLKQDQRLDWAFGDPDRPWRKRPADDTTVGTTAKRPRLPCRPRRCKTVAKKRLSTLYSIRTRRTHLALVQ